MLVVLLLGCVLFYTERRRGWTADEITGDLGQKWGWELNRRDEQLGLLCYSY